MQQINQTLKLVSDHQNPIDNLHRVNVDGLFYLNLKHYTVHHHQKRESGGCKSGYKVTLDVTGITYHPDTAGVYEEIYSVSGKPVFRYDF